MQTLSSSNASALTDQLFSVFSSVTQGGDSRLVTLAAELDMTLSQLRALLVMWKAREPVSLGELARGVGLSDAATVRVVDRLIAAGLCDRREDVHDRRIKRISLTEVGAQTVNRLADAKRESLERFVDSLLPGEREDLSLALEPIVARLGLGCVARP